MMMIFAPNSLVRQKEGAQGEEEEEEAGGRRKGRLTEIRRQALTLPQVQLRTLCRRTVRSWDPCMQNTEESIAKYAIDANMFRLGSTNPKKKYIDPGCFLVSLRQSITRQTVPRQKVPRGKILEPFLIACAAISGEKRGVELSSGHSLRSSRLIIRVDGSLVWGTIEVNCLAKTAAISRLRVRVLDEKVMG